uniref:Uncharacterized protein n=1 Tax=Molossus molossus TaxID=27622 RepID=A0A7J8BLG0_MOLMO|nr:hypothetical protein HJG59_010158 [Molossus molossus]
MYHFFFYFLIDLREREKKTQTINLLFHLFVYSLFAPCMCPDLGSNSQPRLIGTTLSPTELPGQGPRSAISKLRASKLLFTSAAVIFLHVVYAVISSLGLVSFFFFQGLLTISALLRALLVSQCRHSVCVCVCVCVCVSVCLTFDAVTMIYIHEKKSQPYFLSTPF